MASRLPKRHYLIFFVGTSGGVVGLFLFANAPVLGLAFLALFVSGLFQSGFVSMQSLLAIESADHAERGVALGVLSTCIGALPLGTLLIGALAELFGTRSALSATSLTGLVLLGLVVLAFRGRVGESSYDGVVVGAAGASTTLPVGLTGDTNHRSTAVVREPRRNS